MKVAIVHDYLNQYGGAERVLEVLHELFPDAPVFTIVYDKKALPQYSAWDIRPSFAQRIPYASRKYRNFVFLFPWATGSFNLKKFDLVISNTHAWGKGINLYGGACHICYCLTPMRYIWDLYQEYRRNEYINPFAKAVLPFWAKRMRRWDVKTSRNVNHYIAISQVVAKRIKEFYQRESVVIYPPCDLDFFKPDGPGDKGFYLTVSRLKAYKRLDLIIEAFNRLNLPLKIVGDGPELKRLIRKANKNIEFLGWIEDRCLLKAYQECRAFVFAGKEDFGLCMVEAQACGKPVIAYGQGGANEIVIEGRTGILFHEHTPEALIQAVNRFHSTRFDSTEIRKLTLRFHKEKFKHAISNFIIEKLNYSPA